MREKPEVPKSPAEAQERLQEILAEHRTPDVTGPLLACLAPDRQTLPTSKQATDIRAFLIQEIISEERTTLEWTAGRKSGCEDAAKQIVARINAKAGAAFVAGDDETANMLRKLAKEFEKDPPKI
jgi:hypothetical protein